MKRTTCCVLAAAILLTWSVGLAQDPNGAMAPGLARLSDQLLDEAERQHMVNERMGVVINGIVRLLRDLMSNGLGARGNAPEMKRAIATLDSLSKHNVPNAARYFEEARRRLAMFQPNLTAADGEIRIIIQRLDEMLKAAGLVGTAEDILSRLRLIIQKEDKLLVKTMQWGRLRIVDPKKASFGRDDLKTGQEQISRSVRLFQGQLSEAAHAEEDVDLAKMFARGVGLMKRVRIDEMLDAAARFIGADKEHSAVSSQMKALAALRELELLLDADKLAKRIEDLKAILAALEQLLKDQQKLTGKTRRVPLDEFAEKKNALMLKQRNLRKTTREIGMMMPTPSKNVKAAEGHMSAAEGEMQSNARSDAVSNQKLAEEAIKRAIAEVEEEYARAMQLLMEQQMAAEWEDALEQALLQIQALIERQKDLMKETQQAADMVPLKAPQANLGVEAGELADEVPAGGNHLADAAGEMALAAKAMPGGKKPPVIQHQKKALAALYRALRAVQRALELAAEGGGAGEGEGFEEGEGEGGEGEGEGEGNMPGKGMMTDDQPGGAAVSRKDRHWDKLQPKEQDALKTNFAGDLPLEYRELLRDYYESLSK